MGSGASRSKPNPAKFKARSKLVGTLQTTRSLVQRKARGGGLVTYTDTTAAWEQLKLGANPATEDLPKTTLRYADLRSVKRQKGIRSEDEKNITIPYFAEKVQCDKYCHICGVYTGVETYPCRVCTKIYHEVCLKKIGQCQDAASTDILHRAITAIGWSCPSCDCLSNLLTEEELNELIECFDKYDINQDNSISGEEFLEYQHKKYKEKHGEEMGEDDRWLEEQKFRLMDSDKNGSIGWWEFLNYESTKVLQSRCPNALVRLLSPREIDVARHTFQYFDKDKDGCVTELEAIMAYEQWYSRFIEIQSLTNKDHYKDSSWNLRKHANQSAKLIMTADSDKNGKVTWNEFLLDQALYLISARPNNTNLHTNNRVGLRGIVPPPSDITEPQEQKDSEGDPDSLHAV